MFIVHVQSGVFSELNPNDNWRTQLSSYFTRFVNTDMNAPVVYSAPYVDQTINGDYNSTIYIVL